MHELVRINGRWWPVRTGDTGGLRRTDGRLAARRLAICRHCGRASCPIRIKLETEPGCYVRRVLSKVGLICPADQWRTD